MKLLISISYFIPHISGLTNAVKNFAELFSENGHEVTILTTRHSKRLPKIEKEGKITIRRVPYWFRISKGFFMPSFAATVFALARKSDVIFINLPQFEGFVVASIGKLLGKKVVVIYHCDVTLGEDFLSRFISFVLSMAHFLCLVFTDTIIATSSDFAKHSAMLSGFACKLKTIYPVIVKPEIRENAKRKFVRMFSHWQYTIGFLGRVSVEKGIEYLLAAIPYLKQALGDNFVVILAGPVRAVGEEEYLRRITKLIAEYRNNIIQLGELEEYELGAFYQSLDVLVTPSINSTEAFGMVQVEAMLCGTPAVVTDLPGPRVPIQLSGMGEIVEPKNAKDLAEKIIMVLQNKEYYIKGRKTIEEKLNRKNILKEYEKVLRGI